MNEIQVFEDQPGQWQLQGRKLNDGDILEILRGAEWYEVRVAYHPLLREQRFFFCDQNLPIIEGTVARLIKAA